MRIQQTLVPALLAALVALGGCRQGSGVADRQGRSQAATTMTVKIERTDAEWKAMLTEEQYRILRRKGTEPAFSGRFWNFDKPGTYRCAACGQVLFSSDKKFHSGSGWPSFTKPARPESITTAEDRSHDMVRTEVLCGQCGGHLGHVFDDGPKEATGLRYCLNSSAMDFVPAKAQDDQDDQDEDGDQAQDRGQAEQDDDD